MLKNGVILPVSGTLIPVFYSTPFANITSKMRFINGFFNFTLLMNLSLLIFFVVYFGLSVAFRNSFLKHVHDVSSCNKYIFNNLIQRTRYILYRHLLDYLHNG